MQATLARPAYYALAWTPTAWTKRFTAWRRARVDRLALQAMSEHELRDIGIGRSEIGAWTRSAAVELHAIAELARRP